MRWWEKKVKGWIVPFWYSDTPLVSKRALEYGLDKLADQIRNKRAVENDKNMELKEAIQILKDHNKWRRYDGEIDQSPKMTNPKKLGIAIDKVVGYFEKKKNLSNSTPQ